MTNVFSKKPWLKFYDSDVPAMLEYQRCSYTEYFKKTFDSAPDRVALNYMGKTITYGELDLLTNKFANYLVAQGCQSGDVVGFHGPNIPAGFIAMVGIQKAGCVYTGISPLMTPRELEYQLTDSATKVLVTFEPLLKVVNAVIENTGVKAVMVSSPTDFLPKQPGAPLGELGYFPGIEIIRFLDALEGASDKSIWATTGPDDPMMMMYTGGTTGQPKGAVLTHYNLVSHRTQMAVWCHNEFGVDTWLSAFPIFHQAGNFIALWALASAGTLILLPNPRDYNYIISAIKNYKPHIIINVPTVYLELMKLPEFRALDFSGVKWFMSGASAYPAESIKEFEAVAGNSKLIEVCGMTETSPIIVSLPHHGKKKVGSVGLPVSDTNVKLVDPLTGEIVGVGEPGELVAYGPQVFTQGYHNKPEETAHTLRDGWIYTGDIMEMDEDGYFYVVDRLKDMVSVSGFKVFSREIDEILAAHPAVDVAATVGIPDPARPGSEIVASAIVLKPGKKITESDIVEYMKPKVASYKIPKVIEFMDQLPMSSVGKVLKRELRTMIKAK